MVTLFAPLIYLSSLALRTLNINLYTYLKNNIFKNIRRANDLSYEFLPDSTYTIPEKAKIVGDILRSAGLKTHFSDFIVMHIVGHNLLRTWNYLRGMSFFEEFFRPEYHQQGSLLSEKFFGAFPRSFYFHSMNNFYLDRISIFIREWGLVLFSIGLIFSQALTVFAIHGFIEDDIEHLFLYTSLFSLVLLIWSLWSALKIWLNTKSNAFEKKYFLGLAGKYPNQHRLFLISAIFLTGSPATFEFFIEEGVLDQLWMKSHLFLVVAIVCLTLNTVHTFKIGQTAFLGENKTI